jgi:hypothetical protein
MLNDVRVLDRECDGKLSYPQIVDKHNVLHSSGREERPANFMPSRRRGMPGRGFGGFGDWDRMY